MKKRNKPKNKNFLIDSFKESIAFIKESKNYIYSITALFFFFALVGFFVPVPLEIESQIIEFFQEIIAETEGMSSIELILFITLNNIQSSFFGLFLGIFLGIFPVFSSIFNGYIVGFVSNLSVSNAGFLSLFRLLPHGIFELPALFISLGLGLRLGAWVFYSNKREFKKEFMGSLKAFVIIVIPLLIIAGIIEGLLIFFMR